MLKIIHNFIISRKVLILLSILVVQFVTSIILINQNIYIADSVLRADKKIKENNIQANQTINNVDINLSNKVEYFRNSEEYIPYSNSRIPIEEYKYENKNNPYKF